MHDGISLTDATINDSDAVLAWRNDPQTREASVSQSPVSSADHDRWFARVLADPQRHLYIAWSGEDRAGLCRFDRDGSMAEISINLNPLFRGRGLAGEILSRSIDRFRAQTVDDVTLTATIRPLNAASVRTFEALGFVLQSSEPGLDHYVLEPTVI